MNNSLNISTVFRVIKYATHVTRFSHILMSFYFGRWLMVIQSVHSKFSKQDSNSFEQLCASSDWCSLHSWHSCRIYTHFISLKCQCLLSINHLEFQCNVCPWNWSKHVAATRGGLFSIQFWRSTKICPQNLRKTKQNNFIFKTNTHLLLGSFFILYLFLLVVFLSVCL